MTLTTGDEPEYPVVLDELQGSLHWTPTEMCVPESENNVASDMLCLTFKIKLLEEADILSHLLYFYESQVMDLSQHQD